MTKKKWVPHGFPLNPLHRVWQPHYLRLLAAGYKPWLAINLAGAHIEAMRGAA